MLESIKLFLDVPSCAFVLAVDDDVVERGVVHHYRDYLSIYHHKDTEDAKGVMQHELPITGHEYLEKMIQLPIRLPVIDTVNVRGFLEDNSKGWIELVDKNSTSPQSSVLLDFFKDTIPPKPRKIKRTAKLFEIKLKLLEINGLLGKVDFMFVAKLTMLELFAPKLLRFIQNHGYGLIFNTLCSFRQVGYKARQADELEQAANGQPIEPMDAYLNSLVDVSLIQTYINQEYDIRENIGYTTKEKAIFTKMMKIVEEHFNSRIVFDIDAIFDKQYDTDKLKIIIELQEDQKAIHFEKVSKTLSKEFYQRLFRNGDVDTWISALSDNNALISSEQLDVLITKAKEKIDTTFNNLSFISNPEWVGEVAKYLKESDYLKLLKISHNARFKVCIEGYIPLSEKQIDMFQLTFAEYDKYCEIAGKDKPLDEGWGRGRRPVINISWYDAVEYIQWLNMFLGEDEYTYRLPTKEEWIIACNNGKELKNGEQKWFFGNDESQLKEYAWYRENSDNKTHPVGSLNPNDLNLYDVYGNVWEWCQDRSGEDDNLKILNGGAWISRADFAQKNYAFDPEDSILDSGFRLLRTNIKD